MKSRLLFALLFPFIAPLQAEPAGPKIERYQAGPWEDDYGYRQAVRVGHTLYIAGCTGGGEMPAAIRTAYGKLKQTLDHYGLTFANIVKETVYTTKFEELKQHRAVRKEFYGADFPASTWIQIDRLFNPDYVIEVETIAIIPDSAPTAPAKERNAVVIQADFGGAVMPGVVFAVDRDIPVFTVQPLIELYDIDAAARNLIYTAPAWPAGTVFVSVVDPGVGTKRKSVVLKTKNGQYFVSPDNGTLALVAEELGIEAVREIDEKINRRPGTEWSHTFHGRDVYSYTAGRLAAGVITYEQVGPLLAPQVVTLGYPQPVVEQGTATGMIDISRGHLGNTACRIDRHTFEKLGLKEGDLVVVTIRHAGKVVWEETVPYAHTFGDVPVGKNLMFINSSGYVSLAVNQGNFANTYNIDSGRDWTLAVRRK